MIRETFLDTQHFIQDSEHFLYAGQTDTGLKRTLNEDSLCISSNLGLAVIADGMGGHDAGEVASILAVKEIWLHTSKILPGLKNSDISTQRIIKAAVFRAGETIYALNKDRGYHDGSGMGTTAIAVLFDPKNETFACAHIGDCRLYRYRNGLLEQLTQDHTAIQNWIDTGRRGPAPGSNVLLKALGPTHEFEIDIVTEHVRSKDKLLLCTDGLHNLVKNKHIHGILNSAGDPAKACNELITLANEMGGNDNITVIIIQIK